MLKTLIFHCNKTLATKCNRETIQCHERDVYLAQMVDTVIDVLSAVVAGEA